MKIPRYRFIGLMISGLALIGQGHLLAETEGNDTIETANPITLTQTTATGSVNNPDIDYFKITNSNGATSIKIDLSHAASGSGPDSLRLRVLGPNGSSELSNQTTAGQPYTATYTVANAVSNAIYYIGVEEDSADGNQSYTLTVTRTGGTPTGPEINIYQTKADNFIDGKTKYNFGVVKKGQSKTKTFTIKNSGITKLTGFGITKNGTNSGDFTFTEALKSALAPGKSTTFTVTFKPKATGARSAKLHTSSNDADENPFDFKVAGTGTK